MLRRFDRWLSAFEMVCLGAGTAAAVTVATLQVALRYLGGTGIFWAEEFVVYTFVWVAFLSAGAAVRSGEHLTVEVLQVSIGRHHARRLARVVAGVGIASSVAIAVYGTEFVMTAYEFGQASPALQLPMWMVYLVVPLSGVLLSVRFLQKLFEPGPGAETLLDSAC